MTLDEAVERIARGGTDGQFATITADDAYRDNLTEALPVLEKHGAPLTIYVAPALINGTADLWWDVIDDIVNARDMLFLQTAKRQGHHRLLDAGPEIRRPMSRLHDYLTLDVGEEDQRAVLHDLARSIGVDPDAPRRKTLMSWDEIRTIAAHPLVDHRRAHRQPLQSEAAFRGQGAARDDRCRRASSKSSSAARRGTWPIPMAMPARSAAAKWRWPARPATSRRSPRATACCMPSMPSHLHALPRISVNGRYQRVAHIRTMLSGVTTPLANSGKMVRHRLKPCR